MFYFESNEKNKTENFSWKAFAKVYKRLQKGCNRLQKAAKGYKRLQKATKDSKRLQKVVKKLLKARKAQKTQKAL